MFGWIAGVGTAGSSVVPWLSKAFPRIIGGGVAQILWDLLKEGKINWKNTVIASTFGFLLVFGGKAISSISDQIIKWINS
ncbi:MAG: hypothetical protein WB502_01195 [Thermoactinomyces sp.]